MKKTFSRQPPKGAPEATVWFGGPVDRFKISLRIFGEQLDPEHMTGLLGCPPTVAERKGVAIASDGTRIPKKGRWFLKIDSRECDEDLDVEDGIKMLLERLPSDPDLWSALTSNYDVDVFCGLFLETGNRGFGISPEVSRLLADRHLEVGFDIYFDRKGTTETGVVDK